ncbi:hypothetical protein ACR3IL_03200 [Streptococcus iniae]|uniref:hypothetical protein n=1 Tax=Streptococcus iniae TaxID=1346 RepID=UPI0002EBF7D7|nr:hypothetical protein [Streptococcus iniae]
MKEKRKKIKEEKSINRRSFTNTDFKKAPKIDYFDPIQKKMNKALKIKDFKTYYELYKKRILDNEAEWGIVGRHIVNGIEVHDSDFVTMVLKTIDQ